MQETFLIEENYSFSEYVAANFAVLSRIRPIRKVFIMVVCIGLLVSLLSFGADRTSNMRAAMMAFVPILSLGSFLFVGIILVYLYGSTFKPALIRGTIYKIDASGIERQTSSACYSFAWSQFGKLEETRSMLLLHVRHKNVDSIVVLQNKMFTGEQEMNRCKTFINRMLPL
ncbi:MAG: hypothetical protein P4L51_18425 [Puia sp.]|nr:hypothetical protein [Puia sp.]